MKNYEITFITKEDLEDKPIKKALGDDAKIISMQSLGEKQFVYNIKKENRGFYTSVIISILPEKLILLNKKLTLDDDILRFLITEYKENEMKKEKDELIKVEKVLTEEKPKIKTDEKVVEKETKVEDKPKAKAVTPKKEVPAPKVKEEKKEKEEAVSDEDRLKALDKKLDELLKD